MKVAEVMSKLPARCPPDSTVSEAAALLWNDDSSCLAVVDPDNAPLGIVTGRDLLFALAARNLRPAELTAGEALTGDFPSCRTDDDAEGVLQFMEERNIGHLSVVDEAGSLAGVMNLTDIILRIRQKHFKAGAAHRQTGGGGRIPHSLPIV